MSPQAFRQEILEFLWANPGSACSACIASTLALPHRQVVIATLGLVRFKGFVQEPHEACSRCGTRGRVIQAPVGRPPRASNAPPGLSGFPRTAT
jgi:hypothetical protein